MLVLLSSTSFMVGLHRCNGELKEVSFLVHSDGCGHQDKTPPCHRQIEKSCCEDGDVFHESSSFSHHVSGVDVVNFSSAFPCALTDVVISLVVPESNVAQSDFPDYDIPIPILDRPVSNRVLLL